MKLSARRRPDGKALELTLEASAALGSGRPGATY